MGHSHKKILMFVLRKGTVFNSYMSIRVFFTSLKEHDSISDFVERDVYQKNFLQCCTGIYIKILC